MFFPLSTIAFGPRSFGPMLDGDGSSGGAGGTGGQGAGGGSGSGSGTAGSGEGGTGTTGATSGTGGGQSGSGPRTFTQDELNAITKREREETERKTREAVQRETEATAAAQRTEAERKAAEERGEYDTVKTQLSTELNDWKGKYESADTELKDLRGLAQQQLEDLTKDLPDTLKAMLPGESTPLKQRLEAARNARTYHDEQKAAGTGGSGSGGTGGNGSGGSGTGSRGTGTDPDPAGDKGDKPVVKFNLFGRTP